MVANSCFNDSTSLVYFASCAPRPDIIPVVVVVVVVVVYHAGHFMNKRYLDISDQ